MLEGRVLWCFDYEVINRDSYNDIGHQFTGIAPFHCHAGEIYLKNSEIVISGDIDLKLPFQDITQLYLGFDEIYTPILTKSFGLFCQPLRIATNDYTIYLFIDYKFLFCSNNKWFKSVKEIYE